MRLFDAGQRADRPAVVHDRVLTAANAITFLRLLGLPLFVWLMVGPAAYGLAFAVLVVVGVTDWVDGYVARRFDQVTRLGQRIDPLIDRALLATAGITFGVLGIVPWWIIAALVGRDLVLLAVVAVLFRGDPGIPVNRLGKTATALLLIGLPAFLLGAMDWPGAALFAAAAWTLTPIGLLAYYGAGILYARSAADRVASRRHRSRGEQT